MTPRPLAYAPAPVGERTALLFLFLYSRGVRKQVCDGCLFQLELVQLGLNLLDPDLGVGGVRSEGPTRDRLG